LSRKKVEPLNRQIALAIQRFNDSTNYVYRGALSLGLCFAQPRNTVAILPLAAFLEQFRPLKALEHIPFAAQCGSRAQTPML